MSVGPWWKFHGPPTQHLDQKPTHICQPIPKEKSTIVTIPLTQHLLDNFPAFLALHFTSTSQPPLMSFTPPTLPSSPHRSSLSLLVLPIFLCWLGICKNRFFFGSCSGREDGGAGAAGAPRDDLRRGLLGAEQELRQGLAGVLPLCVYSFNTNFHGLDRKKSVYLVCWWWIYLNFGWRGRIGWLVECSWLDLEVLLFF